MDFRFRDKCAYRDAWLKFGANMAVHKSACILGALIAKQPVYVSSNEKSNYRKA